MCRVCDGETFEEYIADARLRIAVNGYMMCGVSDDEVYPWVYTAGLVDAAGHPELIVASVSTETSVEVVKGLAEAIVGGERFEVGEHLRVSGHPVRIGAVDDVQYRLDTFNMWHELREAGVLDAPSLCAVQVILDGGFCREHGDVQPVLSDPDARVGALRVRPNRAARRRGRRRPNL
jgi:hypothetical protein